MSKQGALQLVKSRLYLARAQRENSLEALIRAVEMAAVATSDNAADWSAKAKFWLDAFQKHTIDVEFFEELQKQLEEE